MQVNVNITLLELVKLIAPKGKIKFYPFQEDIINNIKKYKKLTVVPPYRLLRSQVAQFLTANICNGGEAKHCE